MSGSIPTVSIIMAMKDAERFLQQALDSISAQSFKDYEVIVVDGGSKDNSPSIARSCSKTTLLKQQGTGLAQAWNQAISLARAPFLTFLDSDDLWVADSLEACISEFESDNKLEYVFGRTEFFLEGSDIRPPGYWRELLQRSHLAPVTGASMVRRSVANRIGMFDETMSVASDIPWFVELRETSVTRPLDRLLLRKRLHARNLGALKYAVFKSELLRIARARTAKHRKVAG